jgi:hypothetical protein
MSPSIRKVAAVAGLACWLAVPAPAAADLVYLGTTTLTGTGVGTVPTLLTLSAVAGTQQGTSAGASILVDTATGQDVLTVDPDTQTHGGIQTRLLADVGITDPSQFWLVWDLNEPGLGDYVTLTDLSASFYYSFNGSWDLFHVANFDFGTAPALNRFLEESPGTGGAGHVFGLSAAQQDILRLAPGPLRVGLTVGLADESGGFEHFFLAQAPNGPGPVPEPGLVILLGLGALAAARRFGRR